MKIVCSHSTSLLLIPVALQVNGSMQIAVVAQHLLDVASGSLGKLLAVYYRRLAHSLECAVEPFCRILTREGICTHGNTHEAEPF